MIFASGLASMAWAHGMICLGGFVLLTMLTFIIVGKVISSRKNERVRRIGRGIMWFGFAVPFICCLGLFNFDDRSHLKRSVHEGMTRTEVLAILGNPYSVQMDQDLWLYHSRWKFETYGVLFDDKGLVKWTFSD